MKDPFPTHHSVRIIPPCNSSCNCLPLGPPPSNFLSTRLRHQCPCAILPLGLSCARLCCVWPNTGGRRFHRHSRGSLTSVFDGGMAQTGRQKNGYPHMVQEFISFGKERWSTDSYEGLWDGYSPKGRRERCWREYGEYGGFWRREWEFQRTGAQVGLIVIFVYLCFGLIPVNHGDGWDILCKQPFEVELDWKSVAIAKL